MVSERGGMVKLWKRGLRVETEVLEERGRDWRMGEWCMGRCECWVVIGLGGKVGEGE